MSANRGGRKQLLQPAIAAARRALQRLDADDVPAPLRRVAAHTGGRLPPPLADRLVAELDASGWLRDKTLEEFGEPDPGSDDPGLSASSLFLVRPERWWLQMAALEGAAAEEQSSEERRRLRDEAAGLAERLAETERRLEAMTAERDRAVQETRGRIEAERRRLAEAAGEERARLARAEASVAEAAGQIEAERAARAEVEGFARLVRSQLLKARRERAEAARRLADAVTAVSAGRDPRSLARAVDELAERARPLLIAPEGGGGEDDRPRLHLPAGIAPDQPSAFDWLAGLEEPFVLLVDGYNVAYLLTPGDATSSRARSRVNQELAGSAGRFRSRSTVVVVYDSQLEGERAAAPGGRGIEVVFAPASRLADEEIVARAAETDLPAVVVSTDREVREQSAAVGALPLWSEALVAWLRRAV